MLTKKVIAFFLSVLLFFFFNNNLPCELYKFYGDANGSAKFVANKQLKTIHPSDIFIKKLTTKTDHIKVRYMGGECSFDASQFPISINVPEFIDVPLSTTCRFFIPAHNEFLYSLRGPPCS